MDVKTATPGGRVRSWHDAEEGQGITEYVLVLALLVFAIMSAVSFTGYGSSLAGVLGNALDAVTTALLDAASGAL